MTDYVLSSLLMKPIDYFPPLEHAVNLIAQEEQGLSATESMDLSNESKNHFRVGIVGSFGDLHTSPRFLNASFLSRMVVLDGIVTSCK
jgi:DNA replication licensing factor MCM3